MYLAKDKPQVQTEVSRTLQCILTQAQWDQEANAPFLSYGAAAA